MGTFALDLQAFADKAKENADLVVRKVVIDIGSSVVRKSPVGDASIWQNPPPKGYVGGRFRANWQYGVGTPKNGVLPDIDPSGSASNARILAGIAPDAAGKIHYLTNNLPYAERLEKGWSKQAPNGMVALTVVEFQQFVDKAVAEVHK